MNWKEIPRPARKADYRYKYLQLLCPPPEDGHKPAPGDPPLPIRAGDVLRISMRRNALETWEKTNIPNVSAWGDMRILELTWKCPCCGSRHAVMIPEAWLDEGRAVFVEPILEGAGHA